MDARFKISKRIVRNPPRTNLEVLGSLPTNIILLIPFVLVVLALALDLNPLMHEQHYQFTLSSCPIDISCNVLNDNNIQLSMMQTAQILGYVDFYIDVDLGNETDSPSLINAHVTPYAVNQHKHITQTFSSSNIQLSAHEKVRLYLSELRLDRPYLLSTSRYVIYNVSLSGYNSNLSKIHTLFSHTTFSINVQRTAFIISRAVLQLSFSLAVMIVLFLWLKNLVEYHSLVSSSPKNLCNISWQHMLAEQIYVVVLLISLLLWQDMFGAILTLLQFCNFCVSDNWVFIACVLKYTGQQGMYFSLLLLVDGVGGSEPCVNIGNRLPAQASYQNDMLWDNTQKPSIELWWKQEDREFSTLSSSRRHEDPVRYALCKSYDTDSTDNNLLLLRSHPYSPFFSDFITLKVIMLVISLFFSAMLSYFKYPESNSGYYFPNESFRHTLYAILSFLMMITRLIWIALLIGIVTRSANRLAAAHYMTSRYLQMAFRVLTEQIGVGLLLLCVTYTGSLYFACTILWSNINKVSFSSSWLEVLGTIQQGCGVWNGEDMHIGELTYFSIVGMVIAFLFAPPLHILHHDANKSEMSGTAHDYLIMEEAASIMSGRDKRDLFSLETAGLLIECSWQAYFIPLDVAPCIAETPSDVIANLLGNNVTNKMNVQQLGLSFFKSFTSERGDIGGYLCMSSERIVVSFRGTVGSANVATDINFMQIQLPDMAISKSYFVDDDLDQGPTDEHTSLTNHFGSTQVEPEAFASKSLKQCCKNSLKYIVSSIPIARQTLPRVHVGFWAAYSSIRRRFLKAFAKCLVEYHLQYGTDPKVYICGHSLGGALALLAALDVSYNADILCDSLSKDYRVPVRFRNCIVYTFGSPRVGNSSFVNMVHDTVKNNIFRVEVDGDVICRMPKLLGLYQHCGIHVLIDAEESGNIIVHPTIVESQLLRRDRGTTAHHTLSKYRECLEACFLPSQLRKYYYKYYILAHATEKRSVSPCSSFNTYVQKRHPRDIPDWLTRSPNGKHN